MKTIIVGAGVQGLACAYALAKEGVAPITVLEARRVGYGASSRAGGGIREQFRNEANILLAKRSMRLFEKLSTDLNYQILFHRGGYMYLNYSDQDAEQAERDVELHNQLGVPTELLSPEAAQKIVPQMNPQGVKVVQYNAHDAACHHDALMWAYLRKIRQMGVIVRQGARVTSLETEGGRIAFVVVGDNNLVADQVIIAAGAWSRDLLATAGVHMPTQPWRREKLVVEPVRHFLEPLISDRGLGVSLYQSPRGELLGTSYSPDTSPSMNWNSSRHMLEKWCRGIYQLFPILRNASVFRTWAGTRDFTPDGTSIFGPIKNVKGLWAVCGQSGTGIMLAPAIAESIAKAIVGKPPDVNWDIFSHERFGNGKELWERQPDR